MSEPTKESSNKITMTLPPVVMASLEAQGAPLDMSGGEWLKHQVIAAYTQREGVVLNLQHVTKDRNADHPELPLV